MLDHITWSVLDKSSKTLYWECAWACSQDLQHKLGRGEYTIVSQTLEEATELVAMECMRVCPGLPAPPYSIPYMYSTFKETKGEHRYITAGHNSVITPLAMLVDKGLQVLMRSEEIQCIKYAENCFGPRTKSGRAKFMWRCKDSLTVGLNIPDDAPPTAQLLAVDAKKCYDNIPISGEYSLEWVMTKLITRAYDYNAGKVLAFKLFKDSVVKACWARDPTLLPANPGVRWIGLTLDEYLEANRFLMHNAVVRVYDTVALQSRGIPMGLPCCVLWCDLWLHWWERSWCERCIVLDQPSLVQQYTPHIFRIVDDLGGVVNGDFLQYLIPVDTNVIGDMSSVAWVYPTHIITIKDTTTRGGVPGSLTPRACSAEFLHMLLNLSLVWIPQPRIKITITQKVKQLQSHHVQHTPWSNCRPAKVKLATLLGTWVPVLLSGNTESGVKADCRKVRNAFKAAGYPKRKILSQCYVMLCYVMFNQVEEVHTSHFAPAPCEAGHCSRRCSTVALYLDHCKCACTLCMTVSSEGVSGAGGLNRLLAQACKEHLLS